MSDKIESNQNTAGYGKAITAFTVVAAVAYGITALVNDHRSHTDSVREGVFIKESLLWQLGSGAINPMMVVPGFSFEDLLGREIHISEIQRDPKTTTITATIDGRSTFLGMNEDIEIVINNLAFTTAPVPIAPSGQ